LELDAVALEDDAFVGILCVYLAEITGVDKCFGFGLASCCLMYYGRFLAFFSFAARIAFLFTVPVFGLFTR
jgi:hypothetical protein